MEPISAVGPLPHDVLCEILRHCSPAQVVAISRVSRAFHAAASDSTVWEPFCRALGYRHRDLPDGVQLWKEVYIRRDEFCVECLPTRLVWETASKSGDPLRSMHFSPDSRLLALSVGVRAEGEISLIDTGFAQVVRPAERDAHCASASTRWMSFRLHSEDANCLRFSPNGQYLASVGDDACLCVSRVQHTEHTHALLDPRQIATGAGFGLTVDWSSDSGLLAVGSFRRLASVYAADHILTAGAAAKTRVKPLYRVPCADPVFHLCFSLGAQPLLALPAAAAAPIHSIRLLDVASGAVQRTVPLGHLAHGFPPHPLAVTPDGRGLVVGGPDPCQTGLVDVRSGAVRPVPDCVGTLSAWVSPRGHLLGVLSDQGQAWVVDLRMGRDWARRPALGALETGAEATSLLLRQWQCAPNGQLLSGVDADSRLWLWAV